MWRWKKITGLDWRLSFDCFSEVLAKSLKNMYISGFNFNGLIRDVIKISERGNGEWCNCLIKRSNFYAIKGTLEVQKPTYPNLL